MNKSSAHRLVGQPVERSEDIRFLTGRGAFVGDLHREDVLTAVILRSNVAHGRITRLDASAAFARPGVRAVLTAASLGEEVPNIPLRVSQLAGFERYLQPVIARERVRYVGEPLAVVIAETGAAAEDALEAIE